MMKRKKRSSKKRRMRNYKDTVFVDLFAKCPEAKSNFLSLYNALHGTNLKLSEIEIKPMILKNTIYTGRYNDVSMLINGKIIVLVEQQSTINQNMPVRFLEYVSRLYEKLIPEQNRYKQRLIKLPKPEFYVFYNGIADYPAETTLRLSDAFKDEEKDVKSENFPLELSVKVYNINKKIPFVAQCAPLSGYAKLVEYAREAKAAGIADWLDYAVQRCIKEEILVDYLKQNSTEVRNMLFGKYDYKTDLRVKQEEAYEAGVSQGISQGISQQKAEDERQLAQKDARIAELEAIIASRKGS